MTPTRVTPAIIICLSEIFRLACNNGDKTTKIITANAGIVAKYSACVCVTCSAAFSCGKAPCTA